METPEIIKKIDWSELRNQKTMLLETINNDAVSPKHKDGLEGILSLIDALQDYAVDEMGMFAIDIYDFDKEEQREQETPTEKFARESAEKIFDELLESDGFHTDDEMPSEFIEGIMVDSMHADIIRAKIRAQILNDLNENPDAFDYDDKNVLIYDSRMREDYEGIATSYIKFLFNDKKVKTLWLCPHCGTDNVQHKAWVNANTNEILDGDVDPEADGYCNDCEQNGQLLTEEIPLHKTVVGFQVVDDIDGDIHPMMDGSFCLYNLTQAREMLNDKHNHSSVHDDNWKLLTIWSGDVEEPTLMFEGDPRD